MPLDLQTLQLKIVFGDKIVLNKQVFVAFSKKKNEDRLLLAVKNARFFLNHFIAAILNL